MKLVIKLLTVVLFTAFNFGCITVKEEKEIPANSVAALLNLQEEYIHILKRVENTSLHEIEARIPKTSVLYGMTAGDMKVMDGVLIKYQPGLSTPEKRYLAGVPLKYQPDEELIHNLSHMPDSAESKALFAESHKEYVSWFANYIGKDLNDNSRSELHTAYLSSHNEILKARALLNDESIEIENYWTMVGQIVSKLAIREYQLFKSQSMPIPDHNPLSHFPADQITSSTFKDLEQAFIKYYTHPLDHLVSRPEGLEPINRGSEKDDNRGIVFLPQFLPEEGTIIGDIKELRKNISLEEYFFKEHVIDISESRIFPYTTERAYPAEYLGIYVYIATSEHPAATAEGILEELASGPHINVLAGLTTAWKRKIVRTTVYGDGSREEKTYTLSEEFFLTWVLVNGCAGGYYEDDLIEIRALSGPYAIPQEAVKFADQGWSAFQSVSYSAGGFGWDYFCQNNANSFAMNRWAIQPVPPNYDGVLVFGPFGLRGIAGPNPCLLPCGVTWYGRPKILRGGMVPPV